MCRRCWQAERFSVGRRRHRNHRPGGAEAWPTLFTEKEAGYAHVCADTVALETTLFFSAKESFYKCQYPLTKEWVGFHVAITRTDQHALAIAPVRGGLPGMRHRFIQ